MSDCYTSGYTCQVYDNHLFNTRNNVYELVLNAAKGCCINVTDLLISKEYGRTFAENDPYWMLSNNLPASGAGFESKIDGHFFKPGHCDSSYDNLLNVSGINLYDYQLSAMTTQYMTLTTAAVHQTIDEKRHRTLGDVIIRNTLSDEIVDVKQLAPTLNALPDIYNNIIDFDLVYEYLIIYTPTTMYIEKLNYNYRTGVFDETSTMPIILDVTPSPTSTLIRPYFNEAKKEIVFGRTVSSNQSVYPELYKYGLESGKYRKIFGSDMSENVLKKLGLPDDIAGKFVVKSINSTHLTYNDILQKYTVSYTGRLSASHAELARVANIQDDNVQYASDIFFIGIHNFANAEPTLDHIDSIIYHPSNKREYITSLHESTRRLPLSGSRVINMGNISDPRTSLLIDPRGIPSRPSKLKEIRYTYAGETTTNTRLPINDMGYANITDISTMAESYVPHASGGATDFASPRYVPVDLNLNLNLEEISVVRVEVECVYYDNHKILYTLLGESRPIPALLLFDDINIVDTISYSTDSSPNLLKIVLETKSPQFLTEVIIDNDSIGMDTTSIYNYEFGELEYPVPSPTPTPTPTSQ